MPAWLTDLLRDECLPETVYIVRVVLSVVLGGLIGLERELRDKPAGFRTIILICVGACVFTILSQVVGGPDWKNTRIAAQVVTGIGFLGAGAIMRDRFSITGMTTASTIWAVAAIGMAVGFGEVALGLLGTAVILVALFLFDVIETGIGNLRDIQSYHFEVPKTDDVLLRIDRLFKDGGIGIRKRKFHEEGKAIVMRIVAMGPKKKHEALRFLLLKSDDYRLRPED
jgi:putative Mg2+ transporter-C (MgtC) family protein